MLPTDRLGLAAFVAMLLGIFTLAPLTADSGFYPAAAGAIALTTATGMLCRHLRVPEGLIHALQILGGLGYCYLTGMQYGFGIHPLPMMERIVDLSVQHIRESNAPMPANLAVRVALVLLVWLVALIGDMLATTLGRPGWVIVPLLTLYLIPAMATSGQVEFNSFALVGIGHLVMLHADAVNRRATQSGPDRARGATALGTTLIGGTAVGLTLALGSIAPLPPDAWNPQLPSGPVEMTDPSLDLRRNLNRPADSPVLSYRTEGVQPGRGTYLRLTTLPLIDSSGWHLAEMQLFGGGIPTAPGLTQSAPPRRTEVSIGQFSSEWLPAPYAPTRLDADPRWRHDPLTLSILATGQNRKQATRNLSYVVWSTDVRPSATEVRGLAAAQPPDAAHTAQPPPGLPNEIAELARSITGNAATDGERALAIERYLQSDRFTYSTRTAPGAGYDALRRFLLDDRTGYCEQFAGAMAVLARSVGIPSRVAVGFLPGEREGDEWRVTSHDMHAWPELYLDKWGWVSFEPTISGNRNGPAPAPVETTSITEEPPTDPGTEESGPAEPDAGETTDAPEPTTPAPEVDSAAGLIAVLVLLLTVGFLAAPMAIRTWRRGRRVRAGLSPPERIIGAWDEVRDLVVDSGRGWPAGTPRQIGVELASVLPGQAGEAAERLALWVERAAYADAVGEVPDLRSDVGLIRDALADHARRGAIRRQLWPRSVWRS